VGDDDARDSASDKRRRYLLRQESFLGTREDRERVRVAFKPRPGAIAASARGVSRGKATRGPDEPQRGDTILPPLTGLVGDVCSNPTARAVGYRCFAPNVMKRLSSGTRKAYRSALFRANQV